MTNTSPYDANNVFAKILRGELPCVQLFEDEHTLSFMDLMPQTPGHALIIPKEAAATLLDASEDAALACVRTTQRIARAVKAALNPPGIMIAQFNGATAGQTVPHLHFHVVPRYDGPAMMMHGTARADDAQLRELAQKIKTHL